MKTAKWLAESIQNMLRDVDKKEFAVNGRLEKHLDFTILELTNEGFDCYLRPVRNGFVLTVSRRLAA